MNRIPQEIHDHIASFLSGEDRPLVASISRKWQRAIEPRSFRRLNIDSTDLDAFAKTFAGNRRAYIKRLSVQIILPWRKYRFCQNDDERKEDDIKATAGIRQLFTVLSGWGPRCQIELCLRFRRRRIDSWYGNVNRERIENTFIIIHEPENLPLVQCVKEFSPTADYKHQLEPASAVALTSRLPRLKSVWWQFRGPAEFPRLRRELRNGVANAPAFRVLPCSTEELRFSSTGSWCHDDEKLPNLVAPLQYDLFSTAFRNLSCDLKFLSYEGQLDPSFFWPSPGEKNASEPLWPLLRTLHVDLDMRSPAGKWYLKSRQDDNHDTEGDVELPSDHDKYLPRGYGSTEDGEAANRYQGRVNSALGEYVHIRFRTWPNDDSLTPVLKAFSKALANMPAIQYASFDISSRNPGDNPAPTTNHLTLFHLTYASPGEAIGHERHIEDGISLLSSPRLLLKVGDWRMSDELEEAFREVGRILHNMETAVRYLPD